MHRLTSACVNKLLRPHKRRVAPVGLCKEFRVGSGHKVRIRANVSDRTSRLSCVCTRLYSLHGSGSVYSLEWALTQILHSEPGGAVQIVRVWSPYDSGRFVSVVPLPQRSLAPLASRPCLGIMFSHRAIIDPGCSAGGMGGLARRRAAGPLGRLHSHRTKPGRAWVRRGRAISLSGSGRSCATTCGARVQGHVRRVRLVHLLGGSCTVWLFVRGPVHLLCTGQEFG